MPVQLSCVLSIGWLLSLSHEVGCFLLILVSLSLEELSMEGGRGFNSHPESIFASVAKLVNAAGGSLQEGSKLSVSVNRLGCAWPYRFESCPE